MGEREHIPTVTLLNARSAHVSLEGIRIDHPTVR
jgi:hypothetical protein